MTTQNQTPTTEACTRVHVKPAEGRAVRMPERQNALMPPEGCEVPHNVYWARRIADGDVQKVPTVTTKGKTKQCQ